MRILILGRKQLIRDRFPKQSKSAIQDTLVVVAERVGSKESAKRWVVKNSS